MYEHIGKVKKYAYLFPMNPAISIEIAAVLVKSILGNSNQIIIK